mmetsp:Transcript_46429/g.104646  ORF Transcript_46429/g.104646 Transcript_46429/m.104646 type:complete len:85 (+) Transcript_46429:665-919(+)
MGTCTPSLRPRFVRTYTPSLNTHQWLVMGSTTCIAQQKLLLGLTAQAAKVLAEDRTRFTRMVRDTFRGRSMQVGAKRYDFPKFE